MSKKTLTTFERELQDEKFKQEFEKGYKEFLLSELLTDLMTENHKSVRGLAEEIGVSPTIIQRMRSGQQKDLKLRNFLTIVQACGYHLFLEKNNRRIEI